jgi:hypothetical protein
MAVQELLTQAREVMTVKRVFGDPIEKNGLTIIPVANVLGGAGGGGPASSGETAVGGGVGLWATPAGVYVIKGDTVTWQPALNLNRSFWAGRSLPSCWYSRSGRSCGPERRASLACLPPSVVGSATGRDDCLWSARDEQLAHSAIVLVDGCPSRQQAI